MQRWLLALLSTVMIFFSIHSYARAEQTGSVVVVVMDYVSIDDLNNDELTGFKKLMEEGAVGLLNNNTGGKIVSHSTHITIGAGTHARGSAAANMAFNVNTKLEEGWAGDIYRWRTGKNPPENGIVQLDIAKLVQINSTVSRSVQIGALGSALHREGFKTAVFGNTDLKDKPGRLAVCIAMDQEGTVDYGKIGQEVLIDDPTFPGGRRSNYSMLLKEVLQCLPEYKLVVVDLGDTGRLHKQRSILFNDVYDKNYQLALKRADDFVTNLAQNLGEKDLLIIVSPTPKMEMLEAKKMLTPVILWGAGFKHDSNSERGMLISGTTKHPGIVMNTDIAPTILSHLNIESSPVISGRPMYDVPVTYDVAYHLQEKQEKLAVTYSARPPLQQGYVLFQIIILAVSLWLIFKSKRGTKLLKPAMLAVVSVPLAYLLLPLLPNPSVPVVGVELILTTAVITTIVILLGRGSFMHSFGILAMATVAVLLVDIVLGQPLQKQAILSYDPMVGARFYGIGNEYMGVLIGATIMSASLLVNNFSPARKIFIPLSGLIFAATLYCMAAPHLGTNVGGTIAASSAFLVTFLLFTGVRFRWRVVALVAAAVILLLTGFIIFDLSRPIQQQSHIGQTARLIIDGGFIEILHIINRKLSMNLKLLRYTVWSKVLLASIVTLAILFYKPRGVMKSIQNKFPYIFKGFIGVVTGALVAFSFNDSGVVAAATTMIFGAPPLIYMVLNEQSERRL
ncbi:hypothetical protein JOC37_002312 [Desulfohalotomaculum tongense]|uniref:hypothetical protein n=1 Tax=Desulforadius tongensis TaxID=1216062 RepID=UPI00195653D5|nr:hypothetical protein [Desulforadius tongensis]MBM7855890.1 hypothetical protein [Desulforadius tongensis]